MKEFSFDPKLDQKYPKLTRFWYLHNFLEIDSLFFCNFAWSCGLTISSKWHSGVVWENSRLPKNWAEHTRNWPVFHTCIIFSRLVCYILLIFCMKLRVYKYITMTKQASLKEFLFAQKFDQNYPNWPVTYVIF